MKPKSPLSGNPPQTTNPTNQNNLSRMDSSRLINPTDYAMDNVRHELETKLRDAKNVILQCYKDIKETNVDEV